MSRVRSAGFAFLAAVAALGSMGAAAQVFRNVGPDGKVTFSDKPPVEKQAPRQVAPSVATPSAGGGGGALPFELRNIANRYPVTLYSSDNCGPCGSARGLLAGRGVPFTEKTVITNEDAAAFRSLSGEVRVPFLTIGSQQLRGYSETEWTQYLDAAGYPKTSQLPSSYRNPPPAPMAPVQQAQRQPDAAPEQPQQPTVQLPSTEPQPAGIRF